MNLPKLIVVTGQPGAGKSTLVHALADAIRCPALCRDEFKEGLVHTFGELATPDDHARLNGQIYDTFFQAVELLLQAGITLVAEAAFQHRLWQPKLQPLQAIAHIRLIICTVDPVLAQARFVQRGITDPKRKDYHGSVLPPAPYEPPQLAVPILNVDTSHGYRPSFEHIKEFALQPTEKDGRDLPLA